MLLQLSTRLVAVACCCLIVLLGSVRAQNLDCPRDWVEYKGTVSCYKFHRYPLMNVQDARIRCAIDGAYLLAVESIAENNFIMDYLAKNDIEQRKWYTSGQELGERWVWTSTGAVFSYDQGFLDNYPMDMGTNLVYAYRCMIILMFIFFKLKNLKFNIKSWKMGMGERFGKRSTTIYMRDTDS